MKYILITILTFISFTIIAHEYLPSKDYGFNDRNEFQIKEGKLFFRSVHGENQWQVVPKIPENAQDIKEISVDDRNVILVDSTQRIFTMFGARGEVDDFEWIDNWGAVGHPKWSGPGVRLPPDVVHWASSFLSTEVDKFLLYPFNNQRWIGQGVNSVYAIRGENNRITLLDPWLPTKVLDNEEVSYDESFEVCGPLNGRMNLFAIASTGSHLFVLGEGGSLWTRLYDFDIAGSDEFFFNYSYDLVPKDPPNRKYTPHWALHPEWIKLPRQLPGFSWVPQKKPMDGLYTDRLGIVKTGEGGWKRQLRVEGINKAGVTGFFYKDLFAPNWSFQKTHRPLLGKIVDPFDINEKDILERKNKDEVNFSVNGSYYTKLGPFPFLKTDYRVVINNFHPYCSPADLEITYKGKEKITFKLHHTHTERRSTRERGLVENDDLDLYGAIEVSKKDWDNLKNLPEWEQDFIDDLFPKNKRFIQVKVSASTHKIKISHSKRILHFLPIPLPFPAIPKFTMEAYR